MRLASTVLTAAALLVQLQPATASDGNAIFPARIETQPAVKPSRPWRIDDIIEVTRVTGIALDARKQNIAFLLELPSLRLDGTRYALYRLDLRKPGATPVKLVESDYLADLQARPGVSTWSVRGEFGKGVQLYEIDPQGKHAPLAESPDVAPVGGTEGLASSSHEGSRPVGIIAYGWAPDGRSLWYTRMRLPDAASRKAYRRGVRWEPAYHYGADFYGPQPADAFELQLFDPATKTSRLVASAPGHRGGARCVFSAICANVGWIDATHLYYHDSNWVMWSFDTRTSQAQRIVQGDSRWLSTEATANGVLSARPLEDGVMHLQERGLDGALLRDMGKVDFFFYGSTRPARYRDPNRGSIHEVRRPDRQGLVVVDPSGWHEVGKITDSISSCDFDLEREAAFCSRETLTDAPEIVRVDLRDGAIRTLTRPNARYDAVQPLQSRFTSWTNKFGTRSNGYVTLPTGYEPGKRYPAVVVTHARDARNEFAWTGFQWAFPIQLLAERGYVVLSVNESFPDSLASTAYGKERAGIPPARVQHTYVEEPVAMMEAAVQAAIAEGIVDPERVGIMGFSRGAEITTATLSQSKLFRAGVSGDDEMYAAGEYFHAGHLREIYRSLFGGSPYDPAAQAAYRAFSPTFRGQEFSGPLLQFMTAAPLTQGRELDTVLRDAGIPTELYFFHDETHVPHRPDVRHAIGNWTIDWLDYWLLDRRDPALDKEEQYRRWDAMRVKWEAAKAQPAKS